MLRCCTSSVTLRQAQPYPALPFPVRTHSDDLKVGHFPFAEYSPCIAMVHSPSRSVSDALPGEGFEPAASHVDTARR